MVLDGVEHSRRILLNNAELNRLLARELAGEIDHFSRLIIEALEAGKKLLIIGNGGSAADAQHMAGELMGRIRDDRRPIAAIALTTDTSVITCIANDFGFDQVFTRQIEALIQPGDVLLAISTSGDSENILQGVKTARKKGALTLGLLGKGGGRVRDYLDKALIIPSDETPRIQEAHLVIEHIICELIDSHLGSGA